MLIAPDSQAQDLVYTPVNPSFGGSALNSNHLLSIANAQRGATARDANTGTGVDAGTGTANEAPSDADLFVRQLEGRLLSALAGQVTEAIFGSNPQDGGLVTFGTTTVQFDRSLDSITLLITDALDGTVTEIIVPQLVTDGL
jgi:curli production assembly/transport component CsgF